MSGKDIFVFQSRPIIGNTRRAETNGEPDSKSYPKVNLFYCNSEKYEKVIGEYYLGNSFGRIFSV